MAQQTKMSLCWDCKRATGGCKWSDNLKPVKGWDAIEIKPTSARPYTTYLVQNCPEFVRDAYDGGLKRSNPNEKLKKLYEEFKIRAV